jgi:hypothetical protein
VPYIALGAGAIVWTIDRTDPQRLPSPGPKAMATVASAVLLVVALDRPLLAWSKAVLGFHGAFASANDVEAMTWIRDHSPRAARVLNYPGDYEHQRDWEAHWAPVITERDCVYFRMQPFFLDAARLGGAPSPPTGRGLTDALNEQRTLLDFWRNPADPSNAERLSNAGVDYVVVPEAVGDPSSLARAWRWRAPALLEGVRSTPRDAPFLHLVHEAGGAQVYEVRASERRAPRSGSR